MIAALAPPVWVRATGDEVSLAFCIRGKSDGRRVWFPSLEQFFLTRERAAELGDLADNVAVLRVTGGCRAVLIDIEPLTSAS